MRNSGTGADSCWSWGRRIVIITRTRTRHTRGYKSRPATEYTTQHSSCTEHFDSEQLRTNIYSLPRSSFVYDCFVDVQCVYRKGKRNILNNFHKNPSPHPSHHFTFHAQTQNRLQPRNLSFFQRVLFPKLILLMVSWTASSHRLTEI